ncbi:hypothetical protein KCU81_g8130, partial [Aureobasidium melanogenum]|uniref:F-box domain-containing protein n=1 Tax=Aureobasidium melanogenum (strain CBS 110374) TaxID=1043003 RepID=A0A074WFC8_AURM1
MAPASFSSLPPELISKICSDPDLMKKDLVALRLTSKAQGIHASATQTFGKRYFTGVSLLYTEYSLETFVKVCGHPIFGPGIRRVELSCTHFDVDAFNLYLKDLVDCDYTRKEIYHQIHLLDARCDAEKSFKVSDARALLEKAFTHLKKSDHSLTIALSTGEYTSIGRSRIFAPDLDSEHFYADVPFSLDLLLGSARQSGCKVSELDIAVAARRFFHNSHNDSSYHVSDLMDSISNLSLELCFVNDYEDDEPRDFTLWMGDLLSYGTDIKMLRLQDLYMSQKAMTGLVESLGSSLRRLTIGCCDVIGSWREVLVSIQQNSSSLDYLQIYDGRIPWLRKGERYEGTAAVQSGLEKMLQVEQDAPAAEMGSDDENDDD